MIRPHRPLSPTSTGRSLRWLAGALILLGAGSLSPASAQVIKGFDEYKNATDLGFKVKVPAEWEFIPGSPADPNLIGKYDIKGGQAIQVGGNFAPWKYSVWLVKFDRRKATKPDSSEGRIVFPGAKDIDEYVRGPELALRGTGWKKVEKEGGPLAIAGIEASSRVYQMTSEGKVDLRLYAATYKLADDLDVGLIANAPGDEKKWSKFENSFNTMGRSLKRIELAKAGVVTVEEGDSAFRTEKRADLKAKIKSQAGWELHETPDYFIVSNNPDKEFIKELKMRIQAIRKTYEEEYPPEKVLELKKLYEAALAKQKADDKAAGKEEPESDGGAGSGDEPAPDGEKRTVAKTARESASPVELSRCSVVRVVQNREQYMSYGGPPSSAGYWNWVEEELVLFDDQAGGGRTKTWQVLNHEAFHQYIFYFFGNLSPHSWYNEGTGDFFSGFQLKNNRFELKPFDWRVLTIKEALRQKDSGKVTFAPLKELVRWTQREYYGQNKYNIDGSDNYAQGWSLVWFLRTGPKHYRGWNKDWTPILDTYLEALAETNDLDQAVDRAFAGVDWDALEKAWIEYTLAI